MRCDVIDGLIFVNLDGKAPPLREWIGLPPGYIENYEIDKMNVVRHVRSEWRANWKTGIDAFYETYHLPFIHPQTQGVMEDFSQYDLYPNGFSRMIVPIGVKSHRVGDQVSVDPYQQYMMKEAGIDPAKFSGTAREVREAIQQAKRARGKRFGLDSTTSLPTRSSPTAGPPDIFRTYRSACIQKASSSCASCRMPPIRSASTTTT